MTQRIQLGTILQRDGRLLLVRPQIGAPWELPGTPFREEDDDMDGAMLGCMESLGVTTPNIEEDFFETVFLGAASDRLVYNLYAPSEWQGEPTAPIGASLGWFTIDELGSIEMDAAIRDAVLQAFGLRERPDTDAQIIEALRGANLADGSSVVSHQSESAAPAAYAPHPPTPSPVATGEGENTDRIARGRDVLRTLSGANFDGAEANLRARIPELADDVLGALGDTWAMPVVDRKTRSMQVVAMLAALGKTGPLRTHIEGALNHGVSPAQVVETLRTVAVYAGFPAALEAWGVMEEVFAKRGIGEQERKA